MNYGHRTTVENLRKQRLIEMDEEAVKMTSRDGGNADHVSERLYYGFDHQEVQDSVARIPAHARPFSHRRVFRFPSTGEEGRRPGRAGTG